MDETAVEPGRLRRAAVLPVKRLGATQFLVAGNDEPTYTVDLSVDPPCYCADRQHRNVQCKHTLASRLAAGDMGLIQMLGNMLLTAEKARTA